MHNGVVCRRRGHRKRLGALLPVAPQLSGPKLGVLFITLFFLIDRRISYRIAAQLGAGQSARHDKIFRIYANQIARVPG